MNNPIDKKIKESFQEFVSIEFDKKIDSSEILISCGNMLIEELKKQPNNGEARYYAIRIANELHFVTKWMAYTKKYDTSPQIKENYTIAFKLAHHYFELKPHSDLIPFIVKILYYEQFNEENNTSIITEIYKKCLDKLNTKTDKLNNSNRPWHAIDN